MDAVLFSDILENIWRRKFINISIFNFFSVADGCCWWTWIIIYLCGKRQFFFQAKAIYETLATKKQLKPYDVKY